MALRTLEIIAVLESVLARYPDHVGANHYYIHAVEASPHASWALESADRLNTLVPNAGHLVHMPSHIYARVGDNAAAIKSNAAAADVDRNYIAATGATGMYPAMYYSHNLHFLAYAAMQAGKSDEARKAAETLAEKPGPLQFGRPVDVVVKSSTAIVRWILAQVSSVSQSPRPRMRSM